MGDALTSLTKVNSASTLSIARNLQRIWSDVLKEPIPPDLMRLVDGLERVVGAADAASGHTKSQA
jgi:hypothetical protein